MEEIIDLINEKLCIDCQKNEYKLVCRNCDMLYLDSSIVEKMLLHWKENNLILKCLLHVQYDLLNLIFDKIPLTTIIEDIHHGEKISDDVLLYCIRKSIMSVVNYIRINHSQTMLPYNNMLTINIRPTRFDYHNYGYEYLGQFIDSKLFDNYNLENMKFEPRQISIYQLIEFYNIKFETTNWTNIQKYPTFITTSSLAFLTMIKNNGYDIFTSDLCKNNFYTYMAQHVKSDEIRIKFIDKMFALNMQGAMLTLILDLEDSDVMIEYLKKINEPTKMFIHYEKSKKNLLEYCIDNIRFDNLIKIIEYYYGFDGFKIMFNKKQITKEIGKKYFAIISRMIETNYDPYVIDDMIKDHSLFSYCHKKLTISPCKIMELLWKYDVGIYGKVSKKMYVMLCSMDSKYYLIVNGIIKLNVNFDNKNVDDFESKINEQWNKFIILMPNVIIKIIFEYNAYRFNGDITFN